MTLYVLRNKETGEYWRRGTSRKQWNPDIAKTTVYTTLASARSQNKVLRWYGLGPAPKVEIVALEAVVKGVIE